MVHIAKIVIVAAVAGFGFAPIPAATVHADTHTVAHTGTAIVEVQGAGGVLAGE